jgi:hypothetical protein
MSLCDCGPINDPMKKQMIAAIRTRSISSWIRDSNDEPISEMPSMRVVVIKLYMRRSAGRPNQTTPASCGQNQIKIQLEHACADGHQLISDSSA